MAVVRSLLAARTGEASTQKAAASRQELPPFRNSVIIFIRVLFYSFRTQFDGFLANQLSPFCKIGVPANHAKPAKGPGRKLEPMIFLCSPFLRPMNRPGPNLCVSQKSSL